MSFLKMTHSCKTYLDSEDFVAHCISQVNVCKLAVSYHVEVMRMEALTFNSSSMLLAVYSCLKSWTLVSQSLQKGFTVTGSSVESPTPPPELIQLLLQAQNFPLARHILLLCEEPC